MLRDGAATKPPRRGCSCVGLLAARASAAADPLARLRARSCARSTSCCFAEIAEHRADPTSSEREDILSMLMPARASRTASAMDDQRAARPADDAAARRPRDDRDGAGLDLRPAAAPPGGAGAPARLARRRARTTTCGRRSPSRCGCARWCRWPAAASPSELRRRRPRRCPPAPTSRPAIWLTHTRADLYPEPFAFRPERFLEDGPDDLRLDPLRRRRPPLPRRRLRRVRDADRPARGAHPLRAAQGQPGARAHRPPQHHPLARDGTPVVVTARATGRASRHV